MGKILFNKKGSRFVMNLDPPVNIQLVCRILFELSSQLIFEKSLSYLGKLMISTPEPKDPAETW